MEETVRYRYNKNPLIEVIFQLRFPTILKVGSTTPDEFQEKIRGTYPFFDDVIEQVNDITFSNGHPTPISRQNKNYSFISSDERYQVNLTPGFISVSTQDYTQWEDYRQQINFIVKAFEDIYHPAFYSRIGLRYEDAITKSRLGLENKKWNELIKPHILGVMSAYDEDLTQSFMSTAEFDNGDDTRLKTHFELVHLNGEKETSFLIDCDYFCLERTNTENMIRISEKLHAHSTNFIRNAITDELHEAMEPIEIATK